MSISDLIQKWSGINKTSKVLIITDDNQKNIADSIKDEKIYNVQIEYFTKKNEFFDLLKSLKSSDLVMVLLSIDTYMKSGVNEYFTAFGKPDWVMAKYIFIRLDISKESLLQGLSTDKEIVYSKIEEMNRFDSEKTITVTSESGTDISFRTCPFTTCSHEITANGGIAFLPPSETSSEVIADTANGKIVVDMTVGQLYHFGKLIGNFGLVSNPVTITVQNGFIVDIEGDNMAVEFKKSLFNLPIECRKIVELGQGLSKMEPVGLIGVDESIIDSCHFGFGDGWKCGTHLDVVIKNPTIKQI
ncbi:MAG: hypothetical protein HDT46_03060 [Ruminococcaceae bacterium]|nr:hypothetical protein [Oscillospiraceae bacterium]